MNSTWQPYQPIRMKFNFRHFFYCIFLLLILPSWAQTDTTVKSFVGLNNVSVSGMANFITFYRDMSQTFSGTSDPGKSWGFTPYTGSNDFSGNFSQQPFLILNVAAKPTATTSFTIDYAMSHLFTGLNSDSSKNITVQNLFQFHGDVDSKIGSFHLRAGGGAMNYSLSPMTVFNKDFREPGFERLPWEWRMNSFDIYQSIYENSSSTAPSSVYNTAAQGFILEGEDLPYHLGFSSFYGRSNSTVTPERAFADYPLQVVAGKIYKVFSRKEQLSINYYQQFGYTDGSKHINDKREIITTAYDLTNSKIQFHGEVGAGRLDNPESDKDFGEALSLSFTLLNAKQKMPIRLQVYRIDKNVAALESAVLNSNSSVHQGGYNSNRDYENSLYPAYLQEVDMLANNRQGLILNYDKSFEQFKIEFGYAISQELENQFQGVSYQHMVNSFARSRFQPWVMGAGSYGRVSNRYRRSFETIALTDGSSALKSFNAFDLTMKSKLKVAQRELILMNYIYFGTVGNVLSPFGDNYINTLYEELSAYYHLSDKLNMLLFYSFQNTKGGAGTELATNGKYLNQNGYGYGFGFDYDFMENAGMYLRHRWMKHSDVNILDDKFKGTETTLELKYYF